MAILLRGIHKRYGQHHAVRGIDLDVPQGELFACLGPNGAGKTTTIKIICGLLRPDQGEVIIGGVDMARHPLEARRQLAYVPDTPFVYEKLTAREFCRFVGQMYEIPAAVAEQRMATWAKRLELSDQLDLLAEGFSHGMRQKLALIAALLHEPSVLVIDEPMVGLDPRARRVVMDIFRELAASGTTVFLSTHTLEIAEELADRIGIIHRGRLIACGPANDLLNAALPDQRQRLEDVFLQLTAEGDAPPTGGEPSHAVA